MGLINAERGVKVWAQRAMAAIGGDGGAANIGGGRSRFIWSPSVVVAGSWRGRQLSMAICGRSSVVVVPVGRSPLVGNYAGARNLAEIEFPVQQRGAVAVARCGLPPEAASFRPLSAGAPVVGRSSASVFDPSALAVFSPLFGRVPSCRSGVPALLLSCLSLLPPLSVITRQLACLGFSYSAMN